MERERERQRAREREIDSQQHGKLKRIFRRLNIQFYSETVIILVKHYFSETGGIELKFYTEKLITRNKL